MKRKRGPESASEKAVKIKKLMSQHIPTQVAIVNILKEDFNFAVAQPTADIGTEDLAVLSAFTEELAEGLDLTRDEVKEGKIFCRSS